MNGRFMAGRSETPHSSRNALKPARSADTSHEWTLLACQAGCVAPFSSGMRLPDRPRSLALLLAPARVITNLRQCVKLLGREKILQLRPAQRRLSLGHQYFHQRQRHDRQRRRSSFAASSADYRQSRNQHHLHDNEHASVYRLHDSSSVHDLCKGAVS